MKVINTILVAVPASPQYQSVVQYAIGMAQDVHAKLTIALVYTHISAMAGDKDETAHQKAYVQSSFQQLREQLLDDPAVDYRSISLDGPLDQAVLAAGPTYRSDLVISAADEQLPLPDLVQHVPYPLLLVPPATTYRPFKRIALAYDTVPLSTSEPIDFVDQLAQTYGADVEVVEFGTAKTLASPEVNRNNVALESLLADVTHRFHFTLGEGTVDEMKHYVDRCHPHVLVVLARRQLPYNVSPLERHTVTVAKISSVPVLVLKS